MIVILTGPVLTACEPDDQLPTMEETLWIASNSIGGPILSNSCAYACKIEAARRVMNAVRIVVEAAATKLLMSVSRQIYGLYTSPP